MIIIIILDKKILLNDENIIMYLTISYHNIYVRTFKILFFITEFTNILHCEYNVCMNSLYPSLNRVQEHSILLFFKY